MFSKINAMQGSDPKDSDSNPEPSPSQDFAPDPNLSTVITNGENLQGQNTIRKGN